eukprot:1157297-Pelagomonas_calceolata.AAC.1
MSDCYLFCGRGLAHEGEQGGKSEWRSVNTCMAVISTLLLELLAVAPSQAAPWQKTATVAPSQATPWQQPVQGEHCKDAARLAVAPSQAAPWQQPVQGEHCKDAASAAGVPHWTAQPGAGSQ